MCQRMDDLQETVCCGFLRDYTRKAMFSWQSIEENCHDIVRLFMKVESFLVCRERPIMW